ncbi:MAG: hypothetical protein IIV85_02865 [Clostridia bacterium]|nr:hypothetical protein [Clostridia bacterium]
MSILVCVGLWQKNNIEAMVNYGRYSQQELEQQLQSNDQQVEDLLQAALEAAKQVDAEISAEAEAQPNAEAESQVTADTPSPSDPSNPASVPETPKAEQPQSKPEAKPQPDPPKAQQPAAGEKAPEVKPPVPTGPTYEQQLKAITDKVYALRTRFLGALDDLQAEAIAAYKAMPREKRTTKNITAFVSTYISKANALEKQCDGEMDKLVGELTQLQKKYGQSMELVQRVKYTYANEKSLKKAWYMAELEKRGFK